MPTRSIALTEDEDRIVDELVRSGRFSNAHEVVSEGLDLLLDSEAADDETKLTRLRAEVQMGIDAIARGEYQEFPSVDDFVDYLKQLGDDVISGKATE